uniref:Uncharacterized protein n=1 Tax=Anguilla anguilla TaxID=7936 RepID=A0A0E9TMX7_ANGAN
MKGRSYLGQGYWGMGLKSGQFRLPLPRPLLLQPRPCLG